MERPPGKITPIANLLGTLSHGKQWRERLGLRSWIGLALGLAGVALLLLSRSGARTLSLPGVAAILLAVVL